MNEVKLLFNRKKRTRRELTKLPIGKIEYEDVEYIRENVPVVLADNETLRVRLIRSEPVTAYRVTVLRTYRESHVVKTRDERTALLKPGVYARAAWWVEKTPDGFTWKEAKFNKEFINDKGRS